MRKVLIANRSAIARRVIRACNEMGLSSVVVYSDVDADAPYLAEASETYRLPGETAVDTYLNQGVLLAALGKSGADAVHPGYGFLSEQASFAQAVIDSGATFIGPQPRWIERMGDKIAARELMAEKGFPVFPGSELITDLDQAKTQARKIGYPVLIKPTAGGGGMGMQIVHEENALENAISGAQAIGERAFSNGGVFLERYAERARHIEFQLLGDCEGNVMHAFERDCSVQRRNQKLIEESPAPILDRTMLNQRAELAAKISSQLGYDNLGTLETLLDQDGELGFLEMNTRIQVEHGVTEMITGMDLVQTQIRLSQGSSLPQQPEINGHAIEARIYAEDPDTLLPSTGKLSVFEVPRLHAVRVETGYQAGQKITPFYDAMLAKVIAHGTTREMAIGRLLVALKAIDIRGVTTNQTLLLKVLGDSAFLNGQLHTGMLNQIMNPTG